MNTTGTDRLRRIIVPVIMASMASAACMSFHDDGGMPRSEPDMHWRPSVPVGGRACLALTDLDAKPRYVVRVETVDGRQVKERDAIVEEQLSSEGAMRSFRSSGLRVGESRRVVMRAWLTKLASGVPSPGPYRVEAALPAGPGITLVETLVAEEVNWLSPDVAHEGSLTISQVGTADWDWMWPSEVGRVVLIKGIVASEWSRGCVLEVADPSVVAGRARVRCGAISHRVASDLRAMPSGTCLELLAFESLHTKVCRPRERHALLATYQILVVVKIRQWRL